MSSVYSSYRTVMEKCLLFSDIPAEELENVLPILKAFVRECKKNEVIIRQGERISSFGIVLSGFVTAKRYTADGKEEIIAKHEASSVFGEILACPNSAPSPVSVVSSADTIILFIEYRNVVSEETLKSKCGLKLVENFTCIMSKQYFELERKARYLSVKSLREKLIEYLSDCKSRSENSFAFSVPFNRDELANYLNVNRSALSRELSRMKAENIIDFDKNTFRLK